MSTWSPFQSPEVRNICANLTPPEHAEAMRRACFYGIWTALTFALPLSLGFLAEGRTYSTMAAMLVVIHIACIPSWQNSMRYFLCSTEWARQNDIRPEGLKLFAFRSR